MRMGRIGPALALLLALPACSEGAKPAGDGSRAGTSAASEDGGLRQAGGAAAERGSDAGRVVRAQGDAPEGYCPGVPVRPEDRPCWDGRPGQSCYQCVSPLASSSTCSGVMQTPVVPPKTCADDSDCARPDTVCDPRHRLANEQGCRGARCDQGGECPEGWLCDPSSPLADPAFLGIAPESSPVVGCRPLACSDPGGPACVGQQCEPSHPAAGPTGCRPFSCDASTPCPDGWSCSAATCAPIPCDQPGGLECGAGYRCAASGGCSTIHCSEPDGFRCPPGSVCDPISSGPGGCRTLACNEPGASACPDRTFCAELTPGGFSCVECQRNEDCGCGSCILRKCYNRPGRCEPGCA